MLFLLVGLFIGIYGALSGKISQIFALNDTVKTWTLDASTTADFTKSLTIIDNSGAQPTGGQVGANEFSNSNFSANISSWNIAAIPTAGWVEVPFNASFTNDNFLVMQYEAKYDCNADGDGDTAATCNAAADAALGLDYRDLTFDSSKVVSTANGAPIVHITQTQALSACPSGTHLISSAEWMTIVRNAEAQTANWANGVVGSTVAAGGGMFRGNVGSTDSVSYNGNDPEYGTGRDAKAKYTLSNGSEIFDMSGNVWEWNSNVQSSTIYTTASWVEWNSGSLAANARSLYGPSSATYLSTYGMGQVYGGALNNAFRRGGSWLTGSSAGGYSLLLNYAPGAQDHGLGFRCASNSLGISQSFSSNQGRSSGGGNDITIGSVANGKVFQSINVGDTSTYDLSVFVYDDTAGNVGGTITSSIAELYYNGSAVSTTYTDMGSGWWKLSGTVTGANESRQYGLIVKQGKNVVADDFSLIKQGEYSVYTTSAYTNALVSTWDTFCEGTLSGSTCTQDATTGTNSSIHYQLCTDDGSTCESNNSWKYWNGSSWETATNTTTHVNTAAQLTQTAMQALPVVSQKISFKAIFTSGGADVPLLPHVSIGLTTDATAPNTNASALTMNRSNGGTSLASNDWTNNDSPYFSWTAGSDNNGGSGLKGYCLYLGTDSAGNPATSKGLLGTSPVSIAGTTCQFIVSSTSIDFATSSFKGNTWLTTSSNPYYLNIKAIDNAGNIFGDSSEQFQFRFDNTAPTNTSYISCASGSFSNVADMNFSWPTTGNAATADSNAGVLGWQYQINSTDGSWLGTTSESSLGVGNYIPTGVTSHTLTENQDGSSIVSGNNIVYLRSVDSAGNISSPSTYRTCNLSYGGEAPAFDGLSTVTVSPSTATANSFALSWPAATATAGQNVAHYYYMVNTTPPSSLATLQGNSTTYVSNGTSTTVAAGALANVNKGSNTVYVVAIDDASTPNYSPSNFITGTFTLNSTDPDNVANLMASDSSIKSQEQWNVTLTWIAPTYKGAGNLTYLIYRSSDGTTFSQVGSTSGLSYVDTTPSSAKYYYKVYTKDGANAQSSGTNAVTITPTGKWTSAPTLQSKPEASSITTKKATIKWSTSRTADSKIQFGTKSGSYGDVEPSNSKQVSSHSIQLTGLKPGTKYYYKAKWTDEDGNTGTSDELTFTTSPAPTVKDVSTRNIGLQTATVEFTSKDASKVKIYYGTSSDFGGVKEISTSTSETTYTAELTGLADGTKYYYKINTFDSENEEYEGTVLDFQTLPSPKISGVRIQQVSNTAQSTLLVTWSTNTEVSSIVSYYPENNPSAAKDEVNANLQKGKHQMIIRGLAPQTNYTLVVKGRDKIGNQAISDPQRLTTATDTRPAQISKLFVEGSTVPQTTGTAQESTAQLIVSWNTDEPATSQVEFGEGTGVTYTQKTQEDSNLTYNHLVIISGLTPSKVYHLRALSKDSAGNIAKSIDTVTITPKTTENALNLVIGNLQEAFGFLGKIGKN